MKTLKTTLATLAIFISTMTMQAQPMSYYAMRENARFLTDRMAYTLGIATSLLDDLYMINYDYICGVNDYLDDVAYGYHYDDYMTVLYARDAALRRLLTPYQWTRLVALDYFYRPITFVNRRWSFGIYVHDPYRTHFYYGVPHHYADYRGGHFFRGMAPVGGPRGPQGGPNRPQHGTGYPGGGHSGDGRGFHIEQGGGQGHVGQGGSGIPGGQDHGNPGSGNYGGGNHSGSGTGAQGGMDHRGNASGGVSGSGRGTVRPSANSGSSSRSSSTPSVRGGSSTPSVRSSGSGSSSRGSSATPSSRGSSGGSGRSSGGAGRGGRR